MTEIPYLLGGEWSTACSELDSIVSTTEIFSSSAVAQRTGFDCEMEEEGI